LKFRLVVSYFILACRWKEAEAEAALQSYNKVSEVVDEVDVDEKPEVSLTSKIISSNQNSRYYLYANMPFTITTKFREM